MAKYIKNIFGAIPHTFKQINIAVNGKNLILTGVNGSGKTSLLREIYRKANLLIAQKKLAVFPKIEKDLRNQDIYLKTLNQSTPQYKQSNDLIVILKKQLEDITSGLQIEFNILNY